MHVLVHGGAGSDPDEPTPRQAVLETAAETGSRAASPIDAVESAVNVLESSPRFNAGVGSAPQSDGVIRTDAGIMTDDRAVGAACSMPGVARAVSVARLVMTETPHILLSSDEAVAFAEAAGIETGVDCWSERTRNRWDDLEPKPPTGDPLELSSWVRERFGGESGADGVSESGSDTESNGVSGGAAGGTSVRKHTDEHDHDTVGAVAFDGDSLAVATSTGGRWLAYPGRVGDVPQVGSGFYCCPEVGVSATGAGEDIARVTLSKRVGSHVEDGCSAQRACDLALEEFAERTESIAGVIAIDSDGRLGSAFNSDEMQTARATGESQSSR